MKDETKSRALQCCRMFLDLYEYEGITVDATYMEDFLRAVALAKRAVQVNGRKERK